MTTVFQLYHVYELSGCTYKQGGCDEVKLIGIYSSNELALAALDRVKDKPGFKERPEGFLIDEVTLDRDGWVDGFISWDEASGFDAGKTK